MEACLFNIFIFLLLFWILYPMKKNIRMIILGDGIETFWRVMCSARGKNVSHLHIYLGHFSW